jgi:hypothetical protein
MLFTNHRSQTSYIGNKIQNSNTVNTTTDMFSILKLRNKNVTTIPKPIVQNEVEGPKLPKKMKWGEPTWFLLHCLAEKVKEDVFPYIRLELLNVIFTICANLPCPDCANHASEYLKSINYKMIQTKEQLKNVLFSFHNMINVKKNMPIFPREQLENKYRNMIFIPTIYAFMEHFQDKHKSIRMIANDFYRARIAEQLKIWFNTNIQNFDR